MYSSLKKEHVKIFSGKEVKHDSPSAVKLDKHTRPYLMIGQTNNVVDCENVSDATS